MKIKTIYKSILLSLFFLNLFYTEDNTSKKSGDFTFKTPVIQLSCENGIYSFNDNTDLNTNIQAYNLFKNFKFKRNYEEQDIIITFAECLRENDNISRSKNFSLCKKKILSDLKLINKESKEYKDEKKLKNDFEKYIEFNDLENFEIIKKEEPTA